jgi:hypothetical protein
MALTRQVYWRRPLMQGVINQLTPSIKKQGAHHVYDGKINN